MFAKDNKCWGDREWESRLRGEGGGTRDWNLERG